MFLCNGEVKTKRKTYTEEQIIGILKALGELYPRYGYLRLHALMKREGLFINNKLTYRVYRDFGMQV